MAYRSRHLTIKLPEADWENVRDISNVQGETLSTTGWKLIQRGIQDMEKELGSSTPVTVRIHRLSDKVKARASLEKELKDAQDTLMQQNIANKDKLLDEARALAEQAGIDLG